MAKFVRNKILKLYREISINGDTKHVQLFMVSVNKQAGKIL